MIHIEPIGNTGLARQFNVINRKPTNEELYEANIRSGKIGSIVDKKFLSVIRLFDAHVKIKEVYNV